MRIACFALLAAFAAATHAQVKVETVDYKGWKGCSRISNGEVELIVGLGEDPDVGDGRREELDANAVLGGAAGVLEVPGGESHAGDGCGLSDSGASTARAPL